MRLGLDVINGRSKGVGGDSMMAKVRLLEWMELVVKLDHVVVVDGWEKC